MCAVCANLDDERVRPVEFNHLGERTASANILKDPDETEVFDYKKASDRVCVRASASILRPLSSANTTAHTQTCKRKQALVDSLSAAQCVCCAKFSVENKPTNFYSPVIPEKLVDMFGHDGLFEHQVMRVCVQTASEALHSKQSIR